MINYFGTSTYSVLEFTHTDLFCCVDLLYVMCYFLCALSRTLHARFAFIMCCLCFCHAIYMSGFWLSCITSCLLCYVIYLPCLWFWWCYFVLCAFVTWCLFLTYFAVSSSHLISMSLYFHNKRAPKTFIFIILIIRFI